MACTCAKPGCSTMARPIKQFFGVDRLSRPDIAALRLPCQSRCLALDARLMQSLASVKRAGHWRSLVTSPILVYAGHRGRKLCAVRSYPGPRQRHLVAHLCGRRVCEARVLATGGRRLVAEGLAQRAGRPFSCLFTSTLI